MANDPENVNLTPQTEEEPTPQISGEPAGQTLDLASDSAITLQDVLASPELQDYIKKEVQSKTDSRLGSYGTRLDSVEGAISKYDALIKGGMSKPEALAKMQGDQRLHDLESEVASLKGSNVVTPSPGGGEELLTEKQASILSEVGLTTKDPRFTQFLRDNPKFKTNEEYFAALDKQALAWQTADATKPQPSGTTVAQVVPAVPAGDGTYTAEKYKTDMLAAQGKPAEVKRIKEAARKDGVDVDNIGFGT